MAKKRYELWIDESGKFEDAEAKKEKENPSLIGGILLGEKTVNDTDIQKLIPPERNHATEMKREEKEKYLIPTLEQAKEEFQARLFYIENPSYESEKTNRELYLRMMAEGLLQLMQVLNAESESVELNVIISRRIDCQAPSDKKLIISEEYERELKRLIKLKKKRNRILLNEKSELKIYIDSGRKSPKLALADYACYVRFRRNSAIFKEVKPRLNMLFEEAFIFTVTEVKTDSYINQLLSNNMVADAVYEVFTTAENISTEKELKKICDRMKDTSYRLVKSQLKQFAADMTSYASNEDDYVMGKRLLKKINEKFIPLLKEAKMPYESCQFSILIQLIDMYLREGDILSARKTLNECKQVQNNFGNSLENVFSYYQLIEKEAILLIDEFRYEEADVLMEKTCYSFEKIMDTIVQDKNLQTRFPNIKSEYFGDALCMKIYAEMFLQRERPSLYKQLCEESELALKQYPASEGELERHRQYRSHIEMEAGNYHAALQWLMKAKMYTELSTEVIDIRDFLYELETTEYDISCQYYIMYYLLIMAEAKKAGDPLADVMYEVMQEREELMKIAGIERKEDGTELKDKFEKVDIRQAAQNASRISYHPKEINAWKMASYLYYDQKYIQAIEYYTWAYKICIRFSNYDTMKITGIGIMAEKICCEMEWGKTKEAEDDYRKLIRQIEQLQQVKFTKETKEFIAKIKAQVELGYKDGALNKEEIYKASRMITY